MGVIRPPVERFWRKVDRGAEDDCWPWTGALISSGYGNFALDGRVGHKVWVLAHRFSYELAHGAVPGGLVLDHLCRNRRCVNPAHLEAVDFAENVRRGINPSRTECINGHPFDDANTYRDRHGHRKCRKCVAAAQRRYQVRKRGLGR